MYKVVEKCCRALQYAATLGRSSELARLFTRTSGARIGQDYPVASGDWCITFNAFRVLPLFKEYQSAYESWNIAMNFQTFGTNFELHFAKCFVKWTVTVWSVRPTLISLVIQVSHLRLTAKIFFCKTTYLWVSFFRNILLL